tara:strand:+ start:6929 stop:8053 length:1125 start_codon:yes stop_codon:yes gene_type:complete
MLAMPIIVLFFQDKGLTLFQIMILQSIYSITLSLSEIPSGYMSDYFGRKNTIIVSSIFTFIGYLIFSYLHTFEHFILAQILIALGGSLMSGSDSALMYETLIEIKNEENYTKYEGRSYAVANFSESIAGLISIPLITISLNLPIHIQTFVLFFCIPVSISLIEPTKKDMYNKSNVSIKKALNFSLIKNLKLKWLIIYSSIIGVATLSAAWMAQPFFKNLDVPLVYYGILWSALNFTAGIGSFRSHNLEKKYNHNKLILILGLSVGISFFFISLNPNYYGILFFFIIYLLRGYLTPFLKNQINNESYSEIRATVLSIRSFILRITFAIIAPLLGYLSDNNKMSFSFLLMSILILIVIVFSFIKIKKLNLNIQNSS